jgi:tetratricopeptide (TPR) repeat protein
VLKRTGKQAEALQMIERVIEEDPQMPLAWIDRGQLLEKMQRDLEALHAYSRAAELRPNWDVPAGGRARVLARMQKHTQVLPLLRPFARKRNCDPSILLAYGYSLWKIGKPRAALRYFIRVTRVFPQRPDAWRLRGRVCLDQDRSKDALTALERARELTPNDRQVQVLYGRALFAEGLFERSLAELPVDVVAHCIFHAFLGLAKRGHHSSEIADTLLLFRRRIFAEPPGPEALAGGLIEFASHMHRKATSQEVPDLRKWLNAISWLFATDPPFEILIKLFDVMLRYKESGDEKILLELPLEQRQLLESKEEAAQKASVTEGQTSSH